MKQIFIKNELKKRQLEEILNSSFLLIGQVNACDSESELQLSQEITNFGFESNKISATFLKKILKENSSFPEAYILSNNLITIFYSKTPRSLVEILNFIKYTKENKKILVLSASLFSNYVPLLTLEFLPKILSPVLNKKHKEKDLLMMKAFYKISTFPTFLKQTS
jgi:hypothetical protein